ncbi:hypothetical protein Trydic_g5701 [Trypoxylus dichotomus]
MDTLQGKMSLNSIKFYNDICSYMSQYQDVNILKQYYMQRSKMISMRDNINIPARDTKSTIKCPRCCMRRLNNNSEYRIASQKTNDRFLRRINKKIISGNLTRYQLKCAKKLQKCLGNQLVIQCKVCRTKSKQRLRRPEDLKVSNAKPLRLQDKREEKIVPSQPKPSLKTGRNKKKKQVKSNTKNKEQLKKLSAFLNVSQNIKTSSLKDFIKSVT